MRLRHGVIGVHSHFRALISCGTWFAAYERLMAGFDWENVLARDRIVSPSAEVIADNRSQIDE